MKAWVLHGINDLRYEDAERPVPRKDEVLVKVMAAGICGSDINRVFRDGMHRMPLIPGHEFSGTVVETGSQTDREWIGKRVGVFPLIPCKQCDFCKKEKFELCRNYDYLGSRRDGGFAEYVSVPIWNLIELPEQVSCEQAAMLEPLSVAVHATRRALGTDLEQADRTKEICVCGLGTIGLFLCAVLLDAGFENVSVIVKKEVQKKMALDLGILNSRIFSFSEKLPLEADIFFDCVGTVDVVQTALKNTSTEGIVVLVGNPNTDMNIDKEIYWKILRNQLTLIGTWNSSFTHSQIDDWHYALKRIEEDEICPEKWITHSYPLQQLNRGLEIMKNKSEEYIKIEMCPNEK